MAHLALLTIVAVSIGFDSFLHGDEPDPKPLAFGFGRRACPGQFVNDAGLYLLIVQTLAVFTIAKAVDEDGGGS
ncbi:hypothetical protein CP533_1433 [Ophiocordyceps camponoti-saundersi (nom. inval.)]|nr:hypothetical protein CP533_1433 [Ophiocordyceps camponoti-saundersi (nom. inval.)]